MSNNLKTNAWDESYKKNDNFVFYPHEEVVRFVARHIRKRTGVDSFQDRQKFAANPRGLDLGCGIGRHVRFMDDLKIEAYGIDLSRVAIEEAKAICERENRKSAAARILVGSVTDMPYDDSFFDFIVSHGVLDSMPLAIAEKAMQEAKRILRPDGRFYLDLISGDDSQHHPKFSGEETVTGAFEADTIQSYFNYDLIKQLTGESFEILECTEIRHTDLVGSQWHSRYHLVLSS